MVGMLVVVVCFFCMFRSCLLFSVVSTARPWAKSETVCAHNPLIFAATLRTVKAQNLKVGSQ